ncbi:MAG TPA: serine/threonine-protein kinase [Polyangiaceae bacterium]
MAPTDGETIADKYRLDGPLGEGGMGIVYAATHTVTRKRVALKVLRGDYAADPRTHQRFLREARAACAVRHPNVVQIHDVIELPGGVPAMVMELLEGETLARRLERGRLDVAELARLMLPVLSAVGTAHELGIVHRDLKPENIFLARRRDGEVDVKVLDFGIAKLTATEGDAARSGGLTGTGSMLGTPFYMSPEQAFGEKDIDHRSDVWSLGVIFYECLAGARPTQADNVGQIMKIVMTDAIPPLAGRVAGLPAEVTKLVARMLQRDRARRPSDLREVAAMLSGFAPQRSPSFGPPRSPRAITLSSEPALARTPDSLGHGDTLEEAGAAGPRSVAMTTGALARPAGAPLRRRPAYLAAAGVGVVVAAAVGVWRVEAETVPSGAALPAAMTATLPPAAQRPTPTSPASASAASTSPPSASAASASSPASAAPPAPARTAATPAPVAPAPRRSHATLLASPSASSSKTPHDPGSYQ